MNTEERLKMLLNATPEKIAAVDAALAGHPESKPLSLRLLKMGEAAKETGLSRTTIWRAIQEGLLKTVEIRRGSHRIAESELCRFIGGGTLT